MGNDKDYVAEVLRLMKEVSYEMISLRDTYTIEDCNGWADKLDEVANICLMFGIIDKNITGTLELILCMLKYYVKAKELTYKTEEV